MLGHVLRRTSEEIRRLPGRPCRHGYTPGIVGLPPATTAPPAVNMTAERDDRLANGSRGLLTVVTRTYVLHMTPYL